MRYCSYLSTRALINTIILYSFSGKETGEEDGEKVSRKKGRLDKRKEGEE